MSQQATVQPAFGRELDAQQRAELWEYNRELKELGFPMKLRRELVEEYEELLRDGHHRLARSLIN